MHALVSSLFLREFDNPALRRKQDSALFNIGRARIAFTTDTYVVDPIFFPGGDIGSLAVCGTVNDLSVCGARPRCLSLGLVIEEGMSMDELERVVRSIARTAKIAGVDIVTGDTKVVEKGSCDRIFINTSGIGEVRRELAIDRIRTGDAVIVSGPVGEHAVSVLSKRGGAGFGSGVRSDVAPLNGIISKVLDMFPSVRFMRDPTRGGLGTTLNEIVEGRRFGIRISERDIPVSAGVKSACEMLGIDPMYLSCEGRFAAIVARKDARAMVASLRKHPLGRGAAMIGHISRKHAGIVYMDTSSGGRRIIPMLSGEQLPRIC